MKITIEEIGMACATAVARETVLEAKVENLAGKLRKLNLVLARETTVNATIDLYTDWERPELAIDAIQEAKLILARKLVEEIMEKDLFVIEIDEQKPYRQLKAEIRILRPVKAREPV